MQVSLKPKDIAPQLLHFLIFDWKKLKPISANTNNKSGIKNKSIRILPKRLMKKLIPKIGITISMINE
jgi:hypothetical protein